MNHPRMTFRGRRWAAAVGLLVALALPKRVECAYPGADPKTCGHHNALGRWCTTVEVEPLGFYLLEHLLGRNVGFAYATEDDCH